MLALLAFTLLAQPAQQGKCAESELRLAYQHLHATFPAEDIPFIIYFTSYNIPEKATVLGNEIELRAISEKALSFTINSCASYRSFGNIVRPKKVDDTLFYVDIRDYGWRIKDIEFVFSIQPYFLAPLVDIKGAPYIFRTDWFIVNAVDSTKQEDVGFKDFVYYVLQYGLGKQPDNLAEFQDFWEIDIKKVRSVYAETGAIIDAGKSGVSRHTRQLRRANTIFGYYWETRDVKAHTIDIDKVKIRDYIEDLFANQADAGEFITSHKNGLQVYLLTAGNNDKFKRVNFADPTLVFHKQDKIDVRVRTFKACVDCHSMGIIPYNNAFAEIYRNNDGIVKAKKDIKNQLDAFYLKNDGTEVEADNKIYAKAVRQCNDLTPEDNSIALNQIYHWYWNEPVNLEKAANEFGLTIPEFKKYIKATTGGRLVILYNGGSVNRDIWDSIHAGGYIQAGFLIKTGTTPVPTEEFLYVKVDDTPIYSENNIRIGRLGINVKCKIIRKHDADWYYVQIDDWIGYVQSANLSTTRVK